MTVLKKTCLCIPNYQYFHCLKLFNKLANLIKKLPSDRYLNLCIRFSVTTSPEILIRFPIKFKNKIFPIKKEGTLKFLYITYIYALPAWETTIICRPLSRK